jgi:hypothetical protein
MYPGLPTRLEKDIKDRYLKEVLKGEYPVELSSQNYQHFSSMT